MVMSLIPGPEDLYLFHEGNLFQSYRMLGAHLTIEAGVSGVRFSVWAPHAREVRVVGDFNRWDGSKHVMQKSASGASGPCLCPLSKRGIITSTKLRLREARRCTKQTLMPSGLK